MFGDIQNSVEEEAANKKVVPRIALFQSLFFLHHHLCLVKLPKGHNTWLQCPERGANLRSQVIQVFGCLLGF